MTLAAERPHAFRSFRKAKPRTVVNIIPLSSASTQSSILTVAGARVYAGFLVLPNLHLWLQKNLQRDIKGEKRLGISFGKHWGKKKRTSLINLDDQSSSSLWPLHYNSNSLNWLALCFHRVLEVQQGVSSLLHIIRFIFAWKLLRGNSFIISSMFSHP